MLDDATGYGRILRAADGSVTGIREHKDATAAEREIREINSGIYAFDAAVLRDALVHVTTDNAQGEKYLTDVLALAGAAGGRVAAVVTEDRWQVEGANDRVQLSALGAEHNRRTVEAWMRAGVTVVDPATTWIDSTVTLDEDVRLLPNTQLHGATTVARDAVVGPDTTLTDVTVGEGAKVIRTHGSGSSIGARASVGPFTYLRPGTVLGETGKIGAFYETKNVTIGRGSKLSHLGYAGDAEIGEDTNIGCGNITANYDGEKKHRTVIGSGVRTGSNTVFVAPVRVGDGAYSGAGAVIRKDVPAGALAVTRGQAAQRGGLGRGQPPRVRLRRRGRNSRGRRPNILHYSGTDRRGLAIMSEITAHGEKKLVLAAGRAHPELAKEIAKELGTELLPLDAYDFANGEIYVRAGESVRGTDAFVIQAHPAPLNNWLMEQLIMIDSLKRASAKRITVVSPFYPYARQDKKGRGREPISARLVADLYKTAGADRIMSVDLHTSQIQGFFDGPVDHLMAIPLLADYIRTRVGSDKVTVVSPDTGRVRVAEQWAERLGGAPLAFVHKSRDLTVPNQAVSKTVVGQIEGRTCVLIDDMIDTGGTISGAVQVLKNAGAKDVIIAATHAVFSDPAARRLSESGAREVVVTNTLPITADKHFPQLTVLSIAPLIARAIREVFDDGSVTSLFDGNA